MIVAVILVIAMTATTFTTQRQLMSKNMPADAMTGPYAQQQKMLLYILPLVFGICGVAFPVGVLFYWTTSNLWTMGQQFYVIRNNPAPGTPAFKAKQDRDRAKGKLDEAGTSRRGRPRSRGRDRPPSRRSGSSRSARRRRSARQAAARRSGGAGGRPAPEPVPRPPAPTTTAEQRHPDPSKKKQGGGR